MKPLTLRAEEALLGAMIASPDIARGVQHYLTAPDFLGERHRELYSAITSALDSESAQGWSWRQRIEAGTRFQSSYLGRPAAACPEAAHGLSYGALVLQASARRGLSRAGHRITTGSTGLQHDVRRLHDADGTGGRRIGQLAYQAELVARQLRALSRVFNPDATWAIAAPSRPASGRARQEQRILAALLQHHPQSGPVLGLAADGFTDPEHRDIFRAIKRLHVNARAIDALTVDWELARNDGNEGTTGLRTAVTATGREPSYVTTLAADGIGAIQLTRTATSLLGAPKPVTAPESARVPGYQTAPGGPLPLQIPEPPDPGPGFPVHRM